jgi:hypothetical protein
VGPRLVVGPSTSRERREVREASERDGTERNGNEGSRAVSMSTVVSASFVMDTDTNNDSNTCTQQVVSQPAGNNSNHNHNNNHKNNHNAPSSSSASSSSAFGAGVGNATAMDATVRAQVEDCAALVDIAALLANEDSDSADYAEHLRSAALKLMAIKGRNRSIYLSVETKRNDAEKERSKVDRLNLGIRASKMIESFPCFHLLYRNIQIWKTCCTNRPI